MGKFGIAFLTGIPWLIGWTAIKLLLTLVYLCLLGWLTR
jgi:hypothetical protein